MANPQSPSLASPNLLEQLLPAYLQRQRWFGAKSRTIASVQLLDSIPMPEDAANALVLLQLSYDDATADTYQLPLCLSTNQALRETAPASILATVTTPSGPAILHDATASDTFRQRLLSMIETSAILPTPTGTIQATPSAAFADSRGTGTLVSRTGAVEQSNTSILYGNKLIMKLFRRLQPGENPDTEIGRFLTEVAHFPRIAPFLGDIRSLAPDGSESGEPTTLAMLQGLVPNEGDGWKWTLDELSRYFDSCATCPVPRDTGTYPSFLTDSPTSETAREHAGLYLEGAALLGRRTAEMHLALATPTADPAFAAEPFTPADLAADAARIEAQLAHTLEALRRGMTGLATGSSDANPSATEADPNPDVDSTSDLAALILSQRRDLLARARLLAATPPEAAGLRIRIHGDYHLGQVLRSRADFVILDFEGEPARTLAERRAKQSPLKDVAGMLRSFSYAAYAGLAAFTQRRPPHSAADAKALDAWTQLWLNAASTEFLRAYKSTIAAQPRLMPESAIAQSMLNACLLEKALYELLYELNNRPAWVRIPLAGILALR
jgi:maltose alpha-D-glucosyltransferase/alpha-amylase